MGEPGPRANVANPALGMVGLGSLPRTPRHDSTGTPRRRPFSTGLATFFVGHVACCFGETALDQAAKHQVIEG